MQQLEPCPIQIGDRGGLPRESHLPCGNCIEVNAEANLRDLKLQRTLLEMQKTLLELIISLETRGPSQSKLRDESHVLDDKNTEDGTIFPPGSMTVIACREPRP